jgi:hypothetical protein
MSCQHDHSHRALVCPCPTHAFLRLGMMMAGKQEEPDPDVPPPSYSNATATEPSRYADGDDSNTRDLFRVVEPGRPLVISGATVLTMASAEPLPNHDVIIVDGVIRAVQPQGQSLPGDAIIVDGSGKHLIPGLTDIHQHPPTAPIQGHMAGLVAPDASPDELTLPYDVAMFQYLAAGITRIQVMAGTVEELAMRAAIRAGRYRGPHMRVGMLVDGSPPMQSPVFSLIVNDREGGRKAARHIAEGGYDFIKPYSILNREAYTGLVEEGLALGMEIMGHIPRAVGPDEAFAMGQTGVAHVFEYFWNDADPDRSSAEVRARRVRASAERGVVVQTTLVAARMLEYDTGWNTEGVSFDDSYDPILRKVMREDSPFIEWFRSDPFLKAGGKDALGLSVAACQALVDAGVPILPGTDCVPSSITGQHSVHDELRMFVDLVGMSPLDTLRAATVECARYQGEEAVAGTVEVGKRADLLLLDANPLEDIGATRMIDTVILGHAILDRASRERGLARLKAAYDAMPVPD